MLKVIETKRSFKVVTMDLFNVLDAYMDKMLKASGLDRDGMDNEIKEMLDMTDQMMTLCSECTAAYINDIDQIKNDLTEIKALLANKWITKGVKKGGLKWQD